MALIKCPKCGKEFSDRAQACPQCGYSIKNLFFVSIGFAIAGLMLFVLSIILPLNANIHPTTIRRILYILFWLYMGAFWIHQIILISPKSWNQKLYPSLGIVICLYYISTYIIPYTSIMYSNTNVNMMYTMKTVELIGLLYGLCILLNSFNMRGYVRYVFAGYGALLIVFEVLTNIGIRGYNGDEGYEFFETIWRIKNSFTFFGMILLIIAYYTPSLLSKLKHQ